MMKAPWDAQDYTNLTLGNSVDAANIVVHLEKASTWARVAQWWTGSWVNTAPRTIYYRPIPSTLWWLMYHSPLRSPAGFMYTLWACHLVCALLAILLLTRLLDFQTAVTAVSVWVSGVMSEFTLSSPLFAMQHWINLPEPWVWSFMLLALWCLLLALDSGNDRWLWGVATFTLLAALTKEESYSLIFLAPLVLWYRAKLTSHWRTLVPMGAVLAVCFALRRLALHGQGHQLQLVGPWLHKAAVVAGGGGGRAIIPTYTLDFVPLGLALFILAAGILIVRGFKSWPYALALTILAAAAVQLTDILSPGDLPGDAWLQLIPATSLAKMPVYWDAIYTLLLAGILLSPFFIRDRRVRYGQLFGWLWLMMSYSPLLLASQGEHGVYGPCLGWGIFAAMPLVFLGRQHLPRLRNRLNRYHATAR